MAQYTALEWFYEETIIKGKTNYYDLFEQAKAMEKEHMQQSIQLPTDEDIEKKIESLKGWVLIEKDFFERGAIWMRNQIINKNK